MLPISHQHIPLCEACYPLPRVGVSRKNLWAKKGEKTVHLGPLSTREPGIILAPEGTRFHFVHEVELCSVDLALSPVPICVDPLSSTSFGRNFHRAAEAKPIKTSSGEL